MFDVFIQKLYANFIQDDRYMYIVNGFFTTCKIALVAIVIGLLLGFVIAIIRSSYDMNKDHSKNGLGSILLSLANKICNLYLTIIRGTPVVVQLLIIYFVIFSTVNVNKTFAAICAFGFNSAAYVAEIVRGGIMSIDKGQLEAGRSLGFSYPLTMIFIILPQAIKNVLPALGNEFIVLIKETSVAGYIAIEDLTKGGDIIRSRTYSAFIPLITVACIYLIVVLVLSKLLNILERRLRAGER